MSKKVWSLRKRAEARIKAAIVTAVVLLVALVALAAWGIWQAQPKPDRLAEVTATAEPTAETATVTVDGEGVATDVTVTVIDPDTGLSAEDGAEGLGESSAAPEISQSEVGDQTGSVISEANVQLPVEREVLLEPGQQITVAAQNGTSANDLTVTVTVDGEATSQTVSGDNAAATVTKENN